MSIFKNTFNPKIQEQLKARGNAFLKKTPLDITYINGRTSFIRMTSGVNVEGIGDALAKNYILQGGILNSNGNLRKGIGSDISFNSYSNYTLGFDGKPILNQRGIRPMPGITGISVKSQSAYGSMRKATINFICHDIKQLEALELLYMRPGFTVLLEWGWAPYIDNSGNLKNDIRFYDLFEANTKDNFQDRCNKLFKKANDEYYGNYEALLGSVQNYSWSAREDGGYDCTTEVVSIGEIMESLKVNYFPNYLSNIKKDGILKKYLEQTISKPKLDKDIVEPFYKDSIVAAILSELIAYGYSKVKSTNKGVGWDLIDTDGSITGKQKHKISFFRITINNNNNEGQNTSKLKDKSGAIKLDEHVYIDLESFINILNKHVIVEDKKTHTPLITLSLRDKEDKELRCLAHPLQISVDPTICLIKNTQFKNIKNLIFQPKPVEIISVSDTGDTPLKDEAKIEAKNAILRFVGSYTDKGEREALEKYIDTYLPKAGIGFEELLLNLANAYEDYKQKIAIFVLKTSNEKNLREEERKKSLGEVIVEKWNDGYFTNHLKEFLNKYKASRHITGAFPTDESYVQFAKKYIAPDPNIKAIADENVNQQLEAINLNKAIEDVDVNLNFLDKLTKEYFIQVPNTKGFVGNIGSIYINLTYALSLITSESLKEQDPKEKREINLYDYIKSILAGIQSSIGNLNNFDIHIDESICRIIDIHVVTEENPNDLYKKAFTFLSDNPTEENPRYNGLFNNVRKYKWTSQIFKEQSTIVAISAQNGGGELGLDNETLVGWNRKIVDRIKPEVAPPTNPKSYVSDKSSILSTLKNNIVNLTDFFDDLNSYWTPLGINLNDRDFDSSNASKYKDALKDMIMSLKALTNDPSRYKSFIPTKLSLEIDGIGGLVIGHIFRMPNELLPIGYKQSKLAYIVTGINHEIQNNVWVTNIDAQTTLLDNPEYEPNLKLEEAINNAKDAPSVIPIPSPIEQSPTMENKVGATPYPGDATFNTKFKNGFIPNQEMRWIEEGGRAEYGGKYLLHPEAASQYVRMKKAAREAGINWTITSAYRSFNHQQSLGGGTRDTVASPGKSPHGWGGAIDIGELYAAVGGSGNPTINARAKSNNKLYLWLKENGPKYNWYNPYRLADGSGTDECWHWEYWGPNVK